MLSPIHPFPARMASEIALDETRELRRGSLVMDPMTGSGTVARVASENGHRALAFDMDPLAVLMTQVWTTPIDTRRLVTVAEEVAAEAEDLKPNDVSLPWIDSDPETLAFIDYWFAEEQQTDLRRISSVLKGRRGTVKDALWIALSRIIITKKRGSSLAWDVSHSRPHRVKDKNDFPVMSEFLKSAEFLAKRLQKQPPPGNVLVRRGDARDLQDVEACSVDAVITSPPYFNAIDYLRGHKLALVWFGYRVAEVRTIRSASIGSGRALNIHDEQELVNEVTAGIPSFETLPRSERRMFERYVIDMAAMISEIYRVLRRQGKAILVVGNSRLRGVDVDNAFAVSTIAERTGLKPTGRKARDLPLATISPAPVRH